MNGIVDLHVHSAPSLLPRHGNDPDTARAARAAGVSTLVLKAHEGSTAERALLAGDGAVGEASTRLGISRKTLWEKMKRHGIDRQKLERASRETVTR